MKKTIVSLMFGLFVAVNAFACGSPEQDVNIDYYSDLDVLNGNGTQVCGGQPPAPYQASQSTMGTTCEDCMNARSRWGGCEIDNATDTQEEYCWDHALCHGPDSAACVGTSACATVDSMVVYLQQCSSVATPQHPAETCATTYQYMWCARSCYRQYTARFLNTCLNNCGNQWGY
jgi:hypothetical protein